MIGTNIAMKMIVVYNSKSGSALGKNELRHKFRAADIAIEEFVEIQKGFEKKLAPHIAKGKSIAVIGGDGTISAVAGCVVGTDATLVPLPGGTLNHFTKDLAVPQDIDAALKALVTGRTRRIDIVSVQSVYFINNSSIGLYPASLHERKEIEPKGVGKWAAASVASLRALISFKTYRVAIDDRVLTTPFVFIGNNRYKLDMMGAADRARLDEGVLTVYVAKTRSRLTLLKIALAALVGNVDDLPEFDEFYPQSLTIEATNIRLSVSHDGEVSRITTPLEYKMRRQALKVLA